MSEFFNNLKENKYTGMFVSGYYNEGEYKEWYDNDQLYLHCFFKHEKLHGEYRIWNINGKLCEHFLYKNGKIIKDLLDE